jgi:hypothetical protein
MIYQELVICVRHTGEAELGAGMWSAATRSDVLVPTRRDDNFAFAELNLWIDLEWNLE